MVHVLQSLFLLLASATRQELARQVKFLKAENEVLRSRLPKRVTVTSKFVKRHADTLWQSDFLSVKALTRKGFAHLYLLAFIHVGSRRAWISPCTEHPDSAWVAQQARNFLMHAEDAGLKAEKLIHDRDTKFTREFDEILESSGVKRVEIPICSPNLNAFVERFIQTVKFECLHHFVIAGQKHLNYLCKEFVAYYNRERCHSRRDNLPPAIVEKPEPIETIRLADVACETRLGGLLKHYWRRAA